jgi:hypothetical protein
MLHYLTRVEARQLIYVRPHSKGITAYLFYAFSIKEHIKNLVRVKHNYRRFPRMFFGVFNENHSRIGAFDKRYKFWKGGKTDNKSVRRLVMGRRTNKISDNLSAHMTVVEVHFYNRALSRKQLMKQYKLIAAKYNFNKIRVR